MVVSLTYTHSLVLVPYESWTTRCIYSAMLVHLSINKTRIEILKWNSNFSACVIINKYSPVTHIYAWILIHTMQHHCNIDYFHFFCHIFWFQAFQKFCLINFVVKAYNDFLLQIFNKMTEKWEIKSLIKIAIKRKQNKVFIQCILYSYW